MKYHMSMTKRYILRWIREEGSREVLNNWEGTDEEAIKAIQEGDQELFLPSECDNPAENGSCGGHPKKGSIQ